MPQMYIAEQGLQERMRWEQSRLLSQVQEGVGASEKDLEESMSQKQYVEVLMVVGPDRAVCSP